jgi:PadR family transcriptional regulator AphA
MSKTNKTKYAILGLLAAGPRFGYDIKKIVDRSIGFFWSENFGHIYPILKRMENGGLVKKRTENNAGKPVKHVYRLTRQGEKEFLEWLKAPVEEQPIRNEMLLKMFFGGQIETGAISGMVLAEKRKNEELMEIFREIGEGISRKKNDDAPYWTFTLNFGMRRSEMIIAWCDETMKALSRMK